MGLDSSEEPGHIPAQPASAIGSITIATHLIDTPKFIDILKCNPFFKSSPAVVSRPSVNERESAFPGNIDAN
jgi:hypothetical protein